MAKGRIKIPNDLAARVKFASDRTCCICRERGKPFQIHHIDGNPSNNEFENLAVLCLEDHDRTQSKGGFGRKLDSYEIIKYRNDWIDRVLRRRNLVDEMAVKRQVGTHSLSDRVEQRSNRPLRPTELKDPPADYINALPEFKSALLDQAQPKLNSGVTTTMTMVRAIHDYIDSITGILVTLSKYYSPEQFGDLPPQEYFSELISSRFRWHRTIAEPYGPGTGGTIVSITVGSGVKTDVEQMVEDMVLNLVGYDSSFDWHEWRKRWRRESQQSKPP